MASCGPGGVGRPPAAAQVGPRPTGALIASFALTELEAAPCYQRPRGRPPEDDHDLSRCSCVSAFPRPQQAIRPASPTHPPHRHQPRSPVLRRPSGPRPPQWRPRHPGPHWPQASVRGQCKSTWPYPPASMAIRPLGVWNLRAEIEELPLHTGADCLLLHSRYPKC